VERQDHSVPPDHEVLLEMSDPKDQPDVPDPQEQSVMPVVMERQE
jgi:hypothetical protein